MSKEPVPRDAKTQQEEAQRAWLTIGFGYQALSHLLTHPDLGLERGYYLDKAQMAFDLAELCRTGDWKPALVPKPSRFYL